MKKTWLKLVSAAAVGLIALSALAQSDYPNKPIKLIVPFPPGGTSDVMGRMVNDELGKNFEATRHGRKRRWCRRRGWH